MTTVPILPWHLPYGHQKPPNFRVCSDVAGDAWHEKCTCGWKCYCCLRRWVWYRKTLHPVHPGRWTAGTYNITHFVLEHDLFQTNLHEESCSSRSSSGVKPVEVGCLCHYFLRFYRYPNGVWLVIYEPSTPGESKRSPSAASSKPWHRSWVCPLHTSRRLAETAVASGSKRDKR